LTHFGKSSFAVTMESTKVTLEPATEARRDDGSITLHAAIVAAYFPSPFMQQLADEEDEGSQPGQHGKPHKPRGFVASDHCDQSGNLTTEPTNSSTMPTMAPLHGTIPGAGRNIAALMMNSMTHVAASPTDHHPSRVLGRERTIGCTSSLLLVVL
jgi:hypothetical protein